MTLRFLFLFSLFCFSFTQITLPLYKSLKNHDYLSYYNVTIESIEYSHFLTDLKLGSPMQSIPLEISMSSDEILILSNKKNYDANKKSILSEKTSRTYQIIKNTKESKIPAIDKFVVYKNIFDLKFKSIEELNIEDTDEISSGILGFSLGNVDDKHKNKFVEQLSQNLLVQNSLFYFNFKSHESNNRVISLEDYLNIKGQIIVGEYPSIISPNEEKFTKEYSLRTAQILQKLQKNPNLDPILYDDSSYSILLDFNKCVGCTQCAIACSTISGQNILECSHGEKSHTASGKLLADTQCISCGQCSVVCPMSAITEHYNKDEVTEVLKNKKGKIVVGQIAPAVRINMAEALGIEAGTISTGKLVTALKMLGFDYIFDITFSADMTIVEEATEFVRRFNDPEAVLPMFTSCCSAWVNYIEKSRPDLIPHLSSCRSPLSMLSSVIKNIFAKRIGVNKEDIYNVGIMPCTAKKDEIKRPQLNNETDVIITSRELAKMIQEAGIDFASLEETELDSIYSNYTGGGALFCATGGVMEAALRSAYKFITGKDMVPIKLNEVRGYENKIKTASIDINGVKINVAVAHGTINAMELIDKIEKKESGFENIHFVEVMACPGGCVIGGGSPRARTNTIIEKRLNATYSIDKKSEKKVAQDNEQLNNLYKESFDGTYGGEKAHELLHTYFTDRKVDKTWGLNFKQINFNHTSVSSFYSQSLIKIENNFIKAPYDFLPVLNREFLYLKDIKEQCSLYHSFKYDFIICKKDFDVDKFPKLEFYSDELNHTFTLNGKDLFVYDTKNNNYIFLIVFDIYTKKQTGWELGLPFLLKHKIFFDYDSESLGIITKISDIKESGLNINFVVTGILFSIIFILLFIVPKNKQRKKRLNELQEEEGEFNFL